MPLLHYATRIIGDRDRARDVVQETFIEIPASGVSRKSDQSRRNGSSLFAAIVPSTFAAKEKRMTYLDEEFSRSARSEQPMPTNESSRSEARGFLMRIVATLPPRQQEVLQLKFQNDLSYQQIAEITKTTANNVGVCIHTALKTLRQKYSAASKDFLPFETTTT